MKNEVILKAVSIVSDLNYDSELRDTVLRMLLMNDTITIASLVQYKEDAMRQVLNKNKEDLSDASALLIRHMDKINTKTLKEDSEKFVKEQGFFNTK